MSSKLRGRCSLTTIKPGARNPPTSDSHFDVTMGSFDGAETCELVGSYLLPKLPLGYRSNIRELKQVTFLSTRTAAGSKLRPYRWRMMASAVLVCNRERES